MPDYTFSDGECRMCGEKTNMVINIKLKAVSLCDNCSKTISLQTIHYLVKKDDKLKEGKK